MGIPAHGILTYNTCHKICTQLSCALYSLVYNIVQGGFMEFINTLRPRQGGRHFPDDILKCIFLNWNVWISLTISLKCVRKVRIDNIPSLVQIMAWHRPGDKPLSEPMMVSLLTHTCVTRPQWVNTHSYVLFVDTGAIILLVMKPCAENISSIILYIIFAVYVKLNLTVNAK